MRLNDFSVTFDPGAAVAVTVDSTDIGGTAVLVVFVVNALFAVVGDRLVESIVPFGLFGAEIVERVSCSVGAQEGISESFHF